ICGDDDAAALHKELSDMDVTIGRKSNFLDEVFSWSLEEIFNDNLYRDQVKRIPESFESLEEYFSSYIHPLLEETRTELRSNLEIISTAPFAQVLSYKKINSCDSHLYNISVGDWKHKKVDRSKAPYNPLPGDVLAIVKFCPETFNDLQLVARTWVLASVTKIYRGESEDDLDDGSSSTMFKVETSKIIGEGEKDDGYSSYFAIFLMNTITNKRIWNALHEHVNLQIIREVLQPNLMDEDTHNPCCSAINGLFENLLVDVSSTLNPSQMEAVVASLRVAHCHHKTHVQLVWGPPGTGKTKTVSTFLCILLKTKVRTLTCAPTNVAIREVASRVLQLVRSSSSEDSAKPFDFLGNILLFGNKQRLNVDSDVEDIYLDYRVTRLAECFAPLTGWRSCFPSLSNFLENCVSDYEIFVQNKLFETRKQGTRDTIAMRWMSSFLEFVRSRFLAASQSVRSCITVFGTHISRSYINESTLLHLRCLWDLLYSFEQMLEDYTDSKELQKLFSSTEVEDSRLNIVPMIEQKRRKCISMLKTLHESLACLNLPANTSKESLTELCFEMASLIFCTASSSSRIYNMQMEPLSLLVIDEAAQLKECESAILLQLPGLKHAILIGDECQLPAMVKSDVAAEAGFGRSLFQRLSLLGWRKHLLNVQYRMHPSISSFPNTEFYSKQITDAPNVRSTSYERQYLAGPIYGPYSFINISEGRDEVDDDGRSRRNMIEAAVVAKILQNLYKTWHHSAERLAVGVVSPYAAQIFTIEKIIGKRYENLNNFVVKVKSVDGFQGGEEDIIILSTVRANNIGQIGFISNRQRTNVALTRARHCLWILGNERTLSRSDSVWKRLVSNAQARNCFFNADEDELLAEAIIHVKKELNQLDDLLDKNSVVFKNARWKVLFSDNFIKSFSKLPSSRVKKSVMNVLVKLSSGWRPKKIRVDPVCDSCIQIAKQYRVEGRYIITTTDIIKETRYIQVMKIWDIIPPENVPMLVKRIDQIYGMFTDDFVSLCKVKSYDGVFEVPTFWSSSLDIVRYKTKAESTGCSSDGDVDAGYAEDTKVSESLLLMKFYSLSAGIVGHLLTDSDGRALDLPFEVTDQEREIISLDKSSFILGRSGTGKTTVLTLKLFQKEQRHQMAMEGLSVGVTKNDIQSDESLETESVLRQLFVTVSPRLCYAIKQHVSHLKSFVQSESTSSESTSIDIDDIDDGDQFRDIPDSFVGLPPNSYPLVLTFNKFLLMLDGTLGESYFHRFPGEVGSSSSGNPSLKSAAYLLKKKEVNYDKFSMSYWPHLNSQLTKKLDASRVFTEIISCIKGGLQVEQTVGGRLTLEGYLNLSKGRTSTLCRMTRETIYLIFLDYEKMKLKRREFDLADVVNDLHRRCKHEGYSGDLIDFVYIDEVQDLTMRQISLFKYICNNVDEGFVFSGDTAQTIARGIDFRFKDVRCLFYKEFMEGKTSVEGSGIHENRYISPIYQLSENFRTHAGILKLGQSVVELIYHFFPHSIDILSPETSLIFGEAPILLDCGPDENAIATIFGNNDNVGCSLVGFGAEQVILVRDEHVQKEVASYVGKNALVLTIVECKGLEFQDVLLYNFFGSSPLQNHWRVLYEYMNDKNLLDSTLPESYPRFSSAKHNVMCSELKQLYVAITRTRQRLWICENKQELSKPMFDYWKKLSAVQVRELDDSLASAMRVASSPEEWKSRGRKLLAVENYEVAAMCFERAGDKHWETLSRAKGLKALASRTDEVDPEAASSMLRRAGELFESINLSVKAADCYYELKDYKKAGNLYLQHCGCSYLEKAGECFTLARCYKLAASVDSKCNMYSQCLSSCINGKLFDEGLQYIQTWKHQNIAKDFNKMEQDFLENCALFHIRQGDMKAMMKFVKAFISEDSIRAFLNKWGCRDELLIFEEELGNFSEAAKIARERGEFLLEADLLSKGGYFKEACEYFLCHVFSSFLWAKGSKGWPLKQFQREEELLLKAKTSALNSGQHLLYEIVCYNIQILLNVNYSLPQLHEFLVFFRNCKNLRGEVVSTRKILDVILHSHASNYELETYLITNPAMHSLQRISEDKVSLETMIYFWMSWQETILSILKYLDTIEANDINNVPEIGEICLNYLGVRKLPSNSGLVYACLHPNAECFKEVKDSFKTFGKSVSIDELQLLVAARNYWSTELVSTGMEVVRVLDELHKRCKEDILSEFCKARVLLLGYEIVQFLSSLRFSKLKFQKSRRSTESSMEEYFGFIFPLDWRKVVNKDVICLREMDVSSKMLEGVILLNVKEEKGLTYGQLGRVAMALLGLPKCKTELYQMVVRRLDGDSPWSFFFKALLTCKRSEPLVTPEFSLACELLEPLREVYDANWRAKDFISPFCFLYLVDRLMVSLLEFHGRMFVTRSSLVEWFIHLEWKGSLVKNFSMDKSGILREAYDFLAQVVHCFLTNIDETVEWVHETVGIIPEDNISLLLLRLVTMMCLIHLNTEDYYIQLEDVLNMGEVTSLLPPVFWDALQERKVIGLFNAVALALNSIGDSLVIVSTGVHSPISISCSDAISVDIENQNREDLLRVLLPSTDGNPLGNISDQAGIDNQEMAGTDSVSKITAAGWNVRQFFETLKLVQVNDNKSWRTFVSNAANLKVQVDQLCDLMRSVTIASERESCGDEDSSMMAEAECALLELRLLSSILSSNGEQLKNSMLIRDSAEKLLSRKQVFEYFLSPLIPPTDPEKHEADDVKGEEIDCESGQETAREEAEAVKDDTSLVTNGNQGSSHGGEEQEAEGQRRTVE
ncbi:hypothetical protein KSS87_006974, partial [Heliosperma pusillum]